MVWDHLCNRLEEYDILDDEIYMSDRTSRTKTEDDQVTPPTDSPSKETSEADIESSYRNPRLAICRIKTLYELILDSIIDYFGSRLRKL